MGSRRFSEGRADRERQVFEGDGREAGILRTPCKRSARHASGEPALSWLYGRTVSPMTCAAARCRLSVVTNSDSPAEIADAMCNASFVRMNTGGADE